MRAYVRVDVDGLIQWIYHHELESLDFYSYSAVQSSLSDTGGVQIYNLLDVNWSLIFR